jgi:hypothetical protein
MKATDLPILMVSHHASGMHQNNLQNTMPLWNLHWGTY